MNSFFGGADTNASGASVPNDHALVLSKSNTFLGGSNSDKEDESEESTKRNLEAEDEDVE